MLKVAVVGTGFIGSVHAKNVARHRGAELVAVNDANLESAEKIAATTGARVVINVGEIFDNKDIEALVDCHADKTHVDYLKRAARAGKAIYCEKPIGLDYREAEQAVSAVRAAGVPVMLGLTVGSMQAMPPSSRPSNRAKSARSRSFSSPAGVLSLRPSNTSKFPAGKCVTKPFIFSICYGGLLTMNRWSFMRLEPHS